MAKPADIAALVKDLTDPPEIPDALTELVQRYIDDPRAREYDETTLRVQFLNLMLEQLGWDPLNRAGRAYSEREVIHEDKVSIDGQHKAPDYAFVTDGRRRFFLEAKRPSVNVKEARDPAYQLRRYCWTAGLPYGLLTDFEEFAIYDCRVPPTDGDSTFVGRVAYFRIEDLGANWPLLHGMFARANVSQGILELLASESSAPAGTRSIDSAFLDEIKQWRRLLAEDIARQNGTLDGVGLGTAVQRLIDRVVFLRIAEARGLEFEGTLQHAADDQPGVYARLLTLFRKADDRYNSGLFHFAGAADDLHLDTVSLGLIVSDEVLRRIIRRLYFPEPYEFSVMPADILGRIYEQFLGERIAVDASRAVTIDLKPEHRKSGGVYYTPKPIVDYIVEETLGPLLAGKDPATLAREKFAIVDPASGSGSFLIAAYQYLLDWHRDHWVPQTKNRDRFLEKGLDGQLRVKTSERKRILLDYIYGVDIDLQAVEVTKLSLLLKVIEGQAQLEFDIGHILPDLDANILCGNSLIDHDFHIPFGVTPEEALNFNPFSWQQSFPEVFKRGGFDAVIGNPPYLNVDDTWGRKDPRLAYLKIAYSEVYSDKTDLLFYFLRKALAITRGEVAFIVSRSFLEADKAQKLRGWLANNARVRSVLDFRHAIVFPKVGINTAIVRLTKSTSAKSAIFNRVRPESLRPGYGPEYLRLAEVIDQITVPASRLSSTAWNFGDEEVQAILDKLDSAGTPVGDILHIGKGMETGANSSFVFRASAARFEELRRDGMLYERARNSDIDAYYIGHSNVQMLYVEDAEGFERLPKDVQQHLLSQETALKARAAYIRGNCEWWRYTWPLHRNYFDRRRIFVPYRAQFNRFAIDEERKFLGITDTTVLYENGQPEDIRYILGVLNTRVLTARFRFIGKLLGGGVFEYYENTVSKLPIPHAKPGEAAHDRIVKLVRLAEDASSDLHTSRIEAEKLAARAALDAATAEIEDIVADRFGLTTAERELLAKQIV